MPKEKPAQYVLVADYNNTWSVTSREASKANLTKLKNTGKMIVGQYDDAVIRIIYVPIDGDLSEANMLTDVEVNSWRRRPE